MTINLANKELAQLVQNHVSTLIGTDASRLKVSFIKRGTQVDTSVEIIAPGEPMSIIDEPAQTEPDTEASTDESQPESPVSGLIIK